LKVEKINLNKKSFAKNQYEKVIDTKFSQLATSVPNDGNITPQTISIDEFFQYYNELFFQIPKFGATNSHEYLIKTSTEYIGSISLSNTEQALIDEINSLQQQNLDLNQKLIQLQISGSSTLLNG